MARITYVKKAQQRYYTVPVIDPETGQQKKTPVMNKRTGEQKVTKTGRPVFLKVTTEDRTKPKPNLRCDFGGCQVGPIPGEIVPGQSYKHITPRSGPYGGVQKNRHSEHPNWNVWEYSSSLSARIAEAQNEMPDVSSFQDPSEVEEALSNVAEMIRSIAEEKRDSASNIEDGFGHPTQMSEELEEIADSLEAWADEIEQTDVPELPDPVDAEEECEACGGTGLLAETAEGDEDTDPEEPCTACEGEGTVTPDEPTEEQIDEWRSEVESAIDIINQEPF